MDTLPLIATIQFMNWNLQFSYFTIIPRVVLNLYFVPHVMRRVPWLDYTYMIVSIDVRLH